jgi:hypothetical protein
MDTMSRSAGKGSWIVDMISNSPPGRLPDIAPTRPTLDEQPGTRRPYPLSTLDYKWVGWVLYTNDGGVG